MTVICKVYRDYLMTVSLSGHDLKLGVKTIANQLGLQKSLNLYSMLLIMPYVQVRQ